jgi:hypothetical protein
VTSRPALAARLAVILARDVARLDEDLAAELDVGLAELSPVIGQLYRQRRADRCAGYLVATPTTQPVPTRTPSTPPEAPMTPPTPPTDDRSALLDAALACAARGWHVFPIRPGAKKPPAFPGHNAADCTGRDPRCRTGHTGWGQRATTDPGRIRRAWTTAPYNVGIATGPSGLLVIDLDTPKPGQHPPPRWALPGITSGADVLAALCDQHGQPWPGDTFTVRTGRGGLHLYFTGPPGARLGNTAGEKGAGLGWLIDTRGHGGYVVAPGSLVTLPDGGGTYQVINHQAPAALPGWLAGLLAPATPESPSLGGRSPRLDQVADLDSYAATALKGETERARTAAAGGRNWALNKAAYQLGRLVATGVLPEDLAAAELYTAASVHFATDPPLTPAEARATITAGLAAGKARPRHITPPATQQGAAA